MISTYLVGWLLIQLIGLQKNSMFRATFLRVENFLFPPPSKKKSKILVQSKAMFKVNSSHSILRKPLVSPLLFVYERKKVRIHRRCLSFSPNLRSGNLQKACIRKYENKIHRISYPLGIEESNESEESDLPPMLILDSVENCDIGFFENIRDGSFVLNESRLFNALSVVHIRNFTQIGTLRVSRGNLTYSWL